MKYLISALTLAILASCGGGTNATDNNAPGNNTTANNTTANNTTPANNTSGNNTTGNTTTNNTTNNTTNTTAPNNTTPNTNPEGLLMPCEELAFDYSCSDPMAAAGYGACSDFFGESVGSPESCEAIGNTKVGATTPCEAYEFYVGSCIYYTDAIPNTCYITHVGADTAEGVEFGRDFWRGACSNWVEP